MAMSGIKARNAEQKTAMAALANKGVQLVIITGEAGSGKTLLAGAYALEQVYRSHKKVIIAKSPVAIDKGIGFLPGDAKQKMLPWLGGLADNFDFLETDMEALITNEVLEIMPISMVQGRSIHKATIIIDEAQNLTLPVLKQLISRVSEDSKMILLGDVKQVFLRGETSGLSQLIEIAATHPAEFIEHVHLIECERSPLCNWAITHL